MRMLQYLVKARCLSRKEACVSMSVAGSLKIVEAVGMPNFAVAMSIALSVFVMENSVKHPAFCRLWRLMFFLLLAIEEICCLPDVHISMASLFSP